MPPRNPKRARWLEISVAAPHEYVEPIASLFSRYGRGGVVIEEAGGHNPDEGERPPAQRSALLRAYLPVSPRYRRNRELLHIGVGLVRQLAPLPELTEREIDEQEWEEAWKAGFAPLRVGRRLLVRAPWHAAPAAPGDVAIEIDPGLAFGTGHHPTTRHMLECVERFAAPGARVLDVGAGSAILMVAALKLGAARAVGLDIDPVAVKTARANLRANGVAARASVLRGTLPHPRVADGAFDLALANIAGAALVSLAPHLRAALRPGGRLAASGVLADHAPSVEQAFAANALRLTDSLTDADWVTLACEAV